VLFVTIYSGIGGGESLQLNLMRALDPARYAIHVLTPRTGDFPNAAAAIPGVQTHCIPYRGTTTFFIPFIWQRFPITGKLRRFLRANTIHAVLSDYHTLPFIVPAARSLNIPVIWNAMGWWFPFYPWQRAFFRNRITRKIAITQAVKDKLLHTPPLLPPESMQVVIPGIDPATHYPDAVSGAAVRERLGIGSDVPLVCMIARFQYNKGHDYFLEAAKQILKAVPNAHFAVSGDNVFGVVKDEAYKQRILEMARSDPQLNSRVTYLGFWPDAREVLAAADVMVISSYYESLSMVALESMAMARPVVSTRVGGPSETMVDGVTGYLVEPRQPERIAEKVIALLNDPALRSRMGQAGYQHVRANFTAQVYAGKIAQIIEDSIAETAQRNTRMR